MERIPTDSHHLLFKESGSTSQIEIPSISISISISEWITDPRLPQELITEILLRLPVKSLLKFKCVSRSWSSLISSPQFIRSHFSQSCGEGEYLNHQLLFTVHDPAPGMKHCSLYSSLHESEPSRHVSDIEYPFQNPDHPPWIIGIANGLVCLGIGLGVAELFLWNPVLGKFRHLPSSNVSLEPPFGSVNYGFGYDESSDDYKVVCLLSFYSEVVFEAEVKIYSLRANSWKRIEDLKGFLPVIYPGVYANGKIYWSVYEYATTHKIVSLDMASEKYGELQQPYYADYYDRKLVVLGGRLFVLCSNSKGRRADLWVMDKYGVEESWCKVDSIPYDDQGFLCKLSSGEIVFENGYGLLVYHSKHKTFRNIELDAGCFDVVVYVESLVWPNGSCL